MGIGSALVTGWSACPAWADAAGGSAASSSSSSSASSHPGKKAKKAEHRVSRAKAATTTSAKAGSSDDAKTRHKADKHTTPVAGQSKSGAASAAAASAAVSTAAVPTAAVATAATTAQESATTVPQAPVRLVAAIKTKAVKATRSAQDPVSPDSSTTALVALAAVRDERNRTSLTAKSANAAAAQTVSSTTDTVSITDTSSTTVSITDTTPNVLVIGVDGTNLSKILADPANANFFALMQGGTTAPASIVGHTTMSNPSWTAILTGAWEDSTGVINNIFTPDTYNRWATVFNQLETLNPGISTTAIADWDVVAAIATAGSIGADHVTYVPRIAGDSNWSQTDSAVGSATVAAITAADPNTANFVFSYFVGVDENGHDHGGSSQQYADAIENFDHNLGQIMQAVNGWEAATGEQWTVIVVTDHGHDGNPGLGHGFQSPKETSTFVVANNPDIFAAGGINTQYQIVDVTPTVVTLFGGAPAANSDGVSLTTLGGSTIFPINNDTALRGAVQDLIGKYGYPDIATNLALDLRTLAADVPYGVNLVTNMITAELQSIAAKNIFVISPLAQLMTVPVKLVGNVLYAATNVVAQIIARLTGVTGASIFPLFAPALPPLVGTADQQAPLTSVGVCTIPGTCGVSSGNGDVAA
jgi:hypothetical protein